MHKIVGACCLSCSCDTRTCKEDSNCCLSKVAVDTLTKNPDVDDRNSIVVLGRVNNASDLNNDNTTKVSSECIKASWLSYRDKDAIETANDLAIPSYFMITQCFDNKTNDLDVENCQSPPDDDGKLMLPVTSSVTGRTYWNSHCARCNNDENDLLPWIPTAKFKIDISYFLNRSQYHGSVYPETYSDVLRFIAETGNIIYTPPFPNEKKLCLRRNTFFTCKQPRRRNTDAAWLEKACKRVYSPVIIEDYIGRRFPFLNIFCYLLLCRNQYMHTDRKEKTQCSGVEDSGRGSLGGLTALLDYTAEENDDNTRTTESRQDKCHCDELYDVHLVSITKHYANTPM